MNNIIKQSADLKDKTLVLRQGIENLMKHKGNNFYKEKYEGTLVEADKSFKLLKKQVNNLHDEDILLAFSKIDEEVSTILGPGIYNAKLAHIKNLPILWNNLDVALTTIQHQDRRIKLKLNNVPKEIVDEVKLDLEEASNCINVEAFRSSIIMAARSLEVCLHRKYFEATGTDLLDSGIGVGKLIGKLRDEDIQLNPGINQVFNLANDCRISSVHKKKNIYLPEETDSLSILQLVNNCVEKLWH